ncbi:MAG: hypothetical protein AB7N76_36435 [Planctomycetota bacterium]
MAQSEGQGGRFRNGGTQLVRHHLLGEDLRASSGGDEAAAGGEAGQTQAPLVGGKTPTERLQRVLDQRVSQQVLGEYMSGRVPEAFAALSPEDQARFAQLLRDQNGNGYAQAYLLRGLAASNSVDDLEWLSGQLEGKSGAWMRNNATLIGHDPLTQQFSDSCVPTVSQALRGELDPVYALRQRQAGDVHKYDGYDPERYNPSVAQEQSTLLANGGGIPVGREELGGLGLDVEPFRDVVNQGAQNAGLSYDWAETPNGEDAARILDSNLARGIPTPLAIVSADSGHAVLGVDSRVRRGQTEYQVYDPWYGKLHWVPRDAVVNDTVDIGTGQPEVLLAFPAR